MTLKNICVIFTSVSVIAAFNFYHDTLSKEREEGQYVAKSGFIKNWMVDRYTNQPAECKNELLDNLRATDADNIDEAENFNIHRYVNDALFSCNTTFHTITLPNLVQAGVETVYLPVTSTIPLEVIKRSNKSDTKMRCSDYVKTIAQMCPNKVSKHIKIG